MPRICSFFTRIGGLRTVFQDSGVGMIWLAARLSRWIAAGAPVALSCVL